MLTELIGRTAQLGTITIDTLLNMCVLHATSLGTSIMKVEVERERARERERKRERETLLCLSESYC
jgi:hypothetical protein